MAERGRARRLLLAVALLVAIALLLLLVPPSEEGAASPSGPGGRTPSGAISMTPGDAPGDAPVNDASASDVSSGADLAAAGPGAPPVDGELAGVVTRAGAPSRERVTLRRVGGGEVLTIAGDEAGAFRLRLARGWWRVDAARPDEDVALEWGGAPESSWAASALAFPWGDPPDVPLGELQGVSAGAPGQALHLDLIPPRLVTGRVELERAGVLPDEERRVPSDPFAGATVELDPDDDGPPLRTESGPDGRFRFQLARSRVSGFALVVATAPGKVSARQPLSEVGLEPLLLALRDGGLTLAGRVVDPAGAPVPDAELEASSWARWESRSYRARSGPDGRFVLEGIAPGNLGPDHAEVDLTARAGRSATRRKVVVGPGQPPLELVVVPRTTLQLRLEAGGAARLEGRRYLAGGEPADLIVKESVSALSLACDQGDWFDLQVTAPGFQPRRVAVRAPCEPLVLRLKPGAGRVTGRVVHADGTPAAEVEVTGGWGVQGLAGAGPAQPGLEEREVTRCEEEATTDGDGAFAIDGLPAAGRVRLSTTRLTPFGSATVGCEPRECVLGGGPVLLTLVAPGSCRVRLRLVDEVGTPLEGAVVHWLGARQERGAFVVDTFRPGPVRLEVSADGRCGRTLDAVVQAGQLLDLGDVRLERAGSLSLSVRWPAAPLADVQVALQTGAGPTETQEPRVPELACEPIVLEGLTPGPTTVRLTARRPDGGRYTAVASASVVAGEAARVELDLRAAPLLPPGEGR